MNKFLIINDEVKYSKEYNLEEIEKQKGVYEVIRVVDKTPLFAKEHVDRLIQSAKLINLDLNMTQDEIMRNICKLSELNNIKEQNIKLLFTANRDFYFFFIKSFYPDKDMIEKGVKTITFNVVRENPNVKFHNAQLRSSINAELKKQDAYEALLIDNENRVVEGSRSNIFFLSNDCLVTAPSGAVLMGITRSKVLDICKDLKIDVVERDVLLNELPSFEGAFMTSTSNNVLPIRAIDDVKYTNFNGRIKKIIDEFEKMLEQDLVQMECSCKKLMKE